MRHAKARIKTVVHEVGMSDFDTCPMIWIESAEVISVLHWGCEGRPKSAFGGS